MMAFDLHAALLLLLAFALGGALAFLLRRRAEHRKMSYLAQATLLSLDDDPGEAPSPGRSAGRSASEAASGAAGPEPDVPPLPDQAPVPDGAPPPAAGQPSEPAPRPARPRRATGAKAAAERSQAQVPQEMIPLAPADPELPFPELPLGLPEAPATAKSKRARARPVPERGTAFEPPAPPASDDRPAKAAPAAAPGAAGTPPPLLAAPEGMADDLKRLKGIGPQNERRLNTLGIYHWRQIAAWSPEEVRWVGATLAFPGRIERENWVTQAQALLDGATPEG